MTKFEIGTAVVLIVAVITGAVYVGQLEGRLRALEDSRAVEKAREAAVQEIEAKMTGIGRIG